MNIFALSWKKLLLLILILPLVLGLLLFGLIQTPPAKDFLTRTVNSLDLGELDIEIKNLRGFLPFNIRLDRLTCSDAQGMFVDLKELELNLELWSPSRGGPGIDLMAIHKVRLERMPQLPAAPGQQPSEREAESGPGIALPFPVFIDALQIPALSLGPEFFGQEATLALSGQGRGQSPAQWAVRLDLEQLHTPGVKLNLAAEMQENPSSLDLDLSFQDQPHGLLLGQSALDLPGPVELTLQGAGPLADWKGKVVIDLARETLCSTQLNFQAGPDQITVSARSELFPSQLLPPNLTPLLAGDRVDLSLAAASGKALSRFRLQEFTLHSELAQMNLQGQVDLEKNTLNAEGSIQISDLEALQPLINTQLSGSARLGLTASGSLNEPDLVMTTRLRRLRYQSFQLPTLEATLRPRMNRSRTGQLTNLEISGELRAERVEQDRAPLIPGPVQAAFQTAWTPASQNLDLRSIRLSLPGMEASVRGQASMAGPFRVRVNTEIDDVHSFPQVQELALHCGVNLQGSFAGDWQQRTMDNRLDISFSDLRGLPQPAQKVLGSQLKITSNLRLHAGEKLSLDSLHISGQQIDLRAKADMSLKDQDLNAEWTLKGPDLGQVHLAGLSGIFSSTGRVNGTLQDLGTEVAMKVANLEGAGLRASQLHCRFNGRIQPLKNRFNGQLDLNLARMDEQISLSSGIHFARQVLRLPDARLQGPQTELTARVEVQTTDQRIQSDVNLSIGQAQALQTFVHIPVQGGLSLSASLNGPLTQPQVSVSGRFKDLRAAGTEIEELDVQAELADIQALAGTITLQGEDIIWGSNRVTTLNLRARGDQGRATARLDLLGVFGQQVELKTQAAISREDRMIRLSLSQGEGRYGNLPFSWSEAMQGHWAAQNLHLSWPKLHLGQGVIQIQAQTGEHSVQGSIQAQNLDLAQLPLPVSSGLKGRANGQARLSGTWAAPEIDFDLNILQLSSGFGQPEPSPEMDVRATGSFASRELKAQLSAQSGSDFDLQADLSLPLDVALQPVNFQPGKKIAASLQARADLKALSTFLPLEGQDLAGDLSADVRVSGSLPRPPIQGSIELVQGRFENISTGTLLADIQAGIELQGYQARIKHLEATDGEQGHIQVSGQVDFDPDQDLVYSLQTALTQATLVRMETATATLSGEIGLQGTSKQAAITGELKAFPVSVGLPDPAPSGLEGLTIITSEEDPAAAQENQASPSLLQNTDLDLHIIIPGGLFVRGRGLDSEWGGDLVIQGTAARPLISGHVAVKRGHLDLLTKRFVLDKGRVTFLSKHPPEPELDVTGSISVGDLVARVHITGRAAEPSIELSSDPALPRDEILARLLFNRELSQITPLQAVKLALAVRTLTSGGGGGLMGSLRQSMGLDELSIETDSQSSDEPGVTVGAGKYLNENVYFKVEKGLEEDDARVVVNIRITPRFSLETRAGSEHQGMYLTWSYSY